MSWVLLHTTQKRYLNITRYISRRGVRAAGGGDGSQGHSAQQGDDQRQPAAQQEHAAHAPSAHGE